MKNRELKHGEIEYLVDMVSNDVQADVWSGPSVEARVRSVVRALFASGLVVLADDLEEIGCFCPVCDSFEYHDERAGHELIHGRGESWRPVYVKRVWGVSDAGWTPRGKRTTSGHLPGSG